MGGGVLAGATILLTELPRFNIIYQSIFLFYLIGIHLLYMRWQAADVKNCEFQRNVAFVSFFNNHAFWLRYDMRAAVLFSLLYFSTSLEDPGSTFLYCCEELGISKGIFFLLTTMPFVLDRRFCFFYFRLFYVSAQTGEPCWSLLNVPFGLVVFSILIPYCAGFFNTGQLYYFTFFCTWSVRICR